MAEWQIVGLSEYRIGNQTEQRSNGEARKCSTAERLRSSVNTELVESVPRKSVPRLSVPQTECSTA